MPDLTRHHDNASESVLTKRSRGAELAVLAGKDPSRLVNFRYI